MIRYSRPIYLLLLTILAFAPVAANEVRHGNSRSLETRLLPRAGERLVAPAVRTNRPRLMFTPETLQLMQERVRQEQEPWHSAATNMVQEAETHLATQPVYEPYTGRNSFEFYIASKREGTLARLHAYAWLLSGDDRFGEEALRGLVAWATAVPTPAADFDSALRFPSTGMEVARGAIAFLETYDLLADHPALSKADKEAIEAWFRGLIKPIKAGIQRWHDNDYFQQQAYQNHLTAHVMGLATIGYTLADDDLVQYAFDHPDNPRDFRQLISGMIFMPGDAPHHREPAFAPAPQQGEIYDRYRHFTGGGRGLQYAHLSLSQLFYTAEIAWNNGIDFYRYTAPGGENLLYPLRFYADIFRTKDASLQGGFYVQDGKGRFPGDPGYLASADESSRIGDWYAAIFEVGNRHYPGTREITGLLDSLDRATVPRHTQNYFFHPVLTHGEPIETPVQP